MDVNNVGKAANGQHINGDVSTHVDALIHFLLGIGPSCQAYQEQQVQYGWQSCCHRAGRIGPQDRSLPPSRIDLHLICQACGTSQLTKLVLHLSSIAGTTGLTSCHG